MGSVTSNLMISARQSPRLSRHGTRLHKWSRGLALAALMASVGSICHGQTDAADRREYAIKAAFLFHFTQFVVWPPEAMPPPGEPIRIGVVHSNPFGDMLEEIVRDETVEGREIEVVQVATVEEARQTQILFIPRTTPKPLRQALRDLEKEPILLVSDDVSFLRCGGMIALVRDKARVGILINRSALDEAGLSASSRLLRLAQTAGSN